MLRQAWADFSKGDLARAWQHCRALVEQHPQSAAGMDVASRVALAMGQRPTAGKLADRAVLLEADNLDYMAQQAFCLLANKKFSEASSCIDVLAAKPRLNAAQQDTLGNLFSQAGDQHQALLHFQQAVALDASRGHYWLNLALALQATGSLEQAEQAFDQCILLNPQEGEAWLHRSRLRTQTADNNHVDALRSAMAEASNWRRKMTLHYALAKELEDLASYSESFEELRRGAGLRRSHMQHDAAADLQAMDAVKAFFADNYVNQAVTGFDSTAPIFIVGLPRTGTTLVERILGNHSEVFSAGELNDFAENLTALVAPMKPADRMDFIRLSAQVSSAELGENYVASVTPMVGDASRFIDKLPLNFLYCGLIHRALPQAKIIHLKRDPMDTCFAIYKTLFKQAYPFSYDLEELGNYYLAYRALLAHWHQHMPGVILDVDYEALVSDPDHQIKRLLDYCELPWEAACSEFHLSQAASMTASLAQVRQPVYTSSVGKWAHYADELGELKAILDAGGIAV